MTEQDFNQQDMDLMEGQNQSLVSEFLDFVKENKLWVLLPLILVILVFALIAAAGPAGQFLYTLW